MKNLLGTAYKIFAIIADTIQILGVLLGIIYWLISMKEKNLLDSIFHISPKIRHFIDWLITSQTLYPFFWLSIYLLFMVASFPFIYSSLSSFDIKNNRVEEIVKRWGFFSMLAIPIVYYITIFSRTDPLSSGPLKFFLETSIISIFVVPFSYQFSEATLLNKLVEIKWDSPFILLIFSSIFHLLLSFILLNPALYYLHGYDLLMNRSYLWMSYDFISLFLFFYPFVLMNMFLDAKLAQQGLAIN